MDAFGRAILFGLCLGFLWGTGGSLAIVYAIYSGGYRKAVKDSLEAEKPRRFRQALEKIQARKAKAIKASSPQ